MTAGGAALLPPRFAIPAEQPTTPRNKLEP
jgi:hypothetical protein